MPIDQRTLRATESGDPIGGLGVAIRKVHRTLARLPLSAERCLARR
jgi:hypothetical protein